ncbi:MAG: serine protease [Deltaproteobacteria bacterium]|nr:serine protease [Deltaproteobacteria bacterium]
MDLEVLRIKLEAAGFQSRVSIAEQTAKIATQKDLIAIAAWLVHDVQSIRLGTIAILGAAHFRSAMGALGALVRLRDGDEQVFALQALVSMAQPGDDDKLQNVLELSLRSGNSFILAQGKALQAKLVGAVESRENGAEGNDGPAPQEDFRPAELIFGLTSTQQGKRREAMVRTLKHHPLAHDVLAESIIETRNSGVRLDLVTGLGTMAPEKVLLASCRILLSGDDDDAALIARMCVRKISDVEASQKSTLCKTLTEARKRFLQRPLTLSALDYALVVFGDSSSWAALASRVDSLDLDVATALADVWKTTATNEWLNAMPELLTSLQRNPRRIGPFASLLSEHHLQLRAVTKRSLETVLARALRTPDVDGELPPFARSLAKLFSRLTAPQRPLPMRLVNALEHSGEAEDAFALIDLYAALGSEDAAERLVEFSRENDLVIAQKARDALETFPAYEVVIEIDDDGQVSTACSLESPDGKALKPGPDGFHDDNGILYLQDETGKLVERSKTPFGGCLCCTRPRVLRIPPDMGEENRPRPRCPQTEQAHLLEETGAVLEAAHALGGCMACDTVRPLHKDDDHVVCRVCNTRHRKETSMSGKVTYVPIKRYGAGERRGTEKQNTPKETSPEANTNEGPVHEKDFNVEKVRERLPKAPSASDLQLIDPLIAKSMNANVFLFGIKEKNTWTGSGVIVACKGNELLILTNKHVVEDQDHEGRPAGKARMFASFIDGQIVEAKVLWSSSEVRPDTALVVAHVDNAQKYSLSPIGDGACLIGSTIFAIGNPLGFSWSYTRGTLSGFRTIETVSGHEVRELQCQVQVGSGSSGGGIYHENGHLVGIAASVYQVVVHDIPITFAISMQSVVDVIRREAVLWQGEPVVPLLAG